MMKWWGWGDEKITFPIQEKPNLWPWIRKTLGITVERRWDVIARSQIQMPKATVNEAFLAELRQTLRADQILSDDTERLLHSYGKSYPDLFRVRQGIIHKAPDLVCLPENHEDVEKIIRLAHQHDVCVIPFGGGTNIVGGVNPLEKKRMVVTLDLRCMNKLLSLDPVSRTATMQCGALGPKLEADLQERGYSLGHYPDSFEYSTLGGWLATRSAGMQSDAYGKIEDMVVSLKCVTPSGTVVTRTVPASSAGPDLNRLFVGSEGVLGVITEATMRVHRKPAVKDYQGFLFPTFEDGVEAIQETIDKGFPPSLLRLQDSWESELAFNFKKPKKGLEGFVQKIVKRYLKAKGYTTPCILIVGYEGDERAVAPTRSASLKIFKKHRGFPLGRSVGNSWSQDKFNMPYLRDYIMDFTCMADVAETSALWSQVLPLYHNSIRAIKDQFRKDGVSGYIGCHISHTYKTGACLYFTFAAQQATGKELEQYYRYKSLITETFLENGGTLSHHHAIGCEHLPWMKKEVSPVGLQALGAVKASLDPKRILNPGKLLPESDGVHAPLTVDQIQESGRGMTGKVSHHPHEMTIHVTRDHDSSPTL